MNKVQKNTYRKIALSALVLVVFPVIALATPTDFKSLINVILDIINELVRFVVVLALLFFLVNIFKLVFAGGSQDKITEAKTYMFYGIIALFVMVSVWGLVNILTSTFFGGAFTVPQLK